MIKTLLIALILISSSYAADFIGLDVRSAGELSSNPAPGAIHIPLSSLDRTLLKRIPKKSHVKVFCESDGRAIKAKKFLELNGYKNVENIGSWREWNELKASSSNE